MRLGDLELTRLLPVLPLNPKPRTLNPQTPQASTLCTKASLNIKP